MDYIDFLNNDIIKQQYYKIDMINPYALNHGLRHIKNVCNIMNELCNTLDIDEKQKEALLIACALHDVGQVDGRDNHGLKSKEFIVKNFKEELQDNLYYNDILESIEKHSDINEDNLTLFCIYVQLCDKLDFSYKRLEDNYREKFRYYCYEDIKEIEFVNTDNNFGINIITNDIEDFEEQLLQERHINKVIKVIENLADRLEKYPIILHNGNKIEYMKG